MTLPTPPPPQVGRSLRRREDLRLITGRGAYLEDRQDPDLLHVAFVRSQVAHARIRKVDASAARGLKGVVAVVTAHELEGEVGPLPLQSVPPPPGFTVRPVPMPCLAGDVVRFVGEAVAAVVATSRAIAVDAAEQVALDLDPLPVVLDPRLALAGGTQLHPSAPGNVLLEWRTGSGDVGAAFAAASQVVQERIRIPRLVAAPIEPRGCLAAHDPARDTLTLWCSSQDPHRPLGQLCQVLGRSRERTRVVVEDVGGAFGSKGGLAAEHAVTAWLAIRLGRPVKWVETRSENFLAAYQGRGMDVEASLAVAADGRFLGLRAQVVADIGAYLLGHTGVVSASLGSLLTGAYDIACADVTIVGAATNKTPTGPLRGAGRPEATLVIERLADLAAVALGQDPVAIRRRNLVAADHFPYRTAVGAVYDSGDYAGLLDRALLLFDYPGWRRRQAAARDRGGWIGVGVAVVVESSGNGAWESAAAELRADGRVLVRSGSCAHGQGHETTFAQIAADALGIEPDLVEVRQGDSADLPEGMGTYASRSAAVGGSAVLTVASELRQRLASWAAHLLDAPEAELHWEPIGFVADGPPRRVATLAEIGRAAAEAAAATAGLPGLRVVGRFALPGLLYGSGAYAAALEIDPQTGLAELLDLVAVDDIGTVLNPLLAEGQVVGSAVQGLAAALFEEVVHDQDGQPQTASWIGYGTPTAAEIPVEIRCEFRATPSPLNPLGAKGVAESGSIGVPAAVANAAADALAPLGVHHIDLPLTPERLWRLFEEART